MENIDIEAQMARIKSARAKAEKITNERNRLQGEIDSLTKQIAELEDECRTKYKCDISQLDALIAKIRTSAETHLAEAERILNPPVSSSAVADTTSLEGLL